MKKICIIQLTRLGDLIQTMHAVREVKSNVEKIELHLIARKQFAHPLRFLLDIYFDKITYVDLPQLIKPTLETSIKSVSEFIQVQGESNYDVLINLSFSKSSSYLSSLINAKYKLGMQRNEHGEIQVYDKWSQFVFSSVMAGSFNPYNLVDLFKNIIGSNNFKDDEHRLIKSQSNNSLITIHPFASNPKKSWSQNKWIEVIYGIAKSNPTYKIIILGGSNEEAKAKKIIQNPLLKSIDIESYVGKKSIEETFEVLKLSSCFIGNDSMISHLASFLDIPILTLSTGPVRPQESVPYRKNVITVCSDVNCFPCTVQTKCDLPKCHQDITHNLVIDLASAMMKKTEINREYIKNNVNVFHLSNTLIYKTQSKPDNTFYLEELTTDELCYNDTIRLINKIVFDLYLKNTELHNDIPKLSNLTAQKLVEDLKIITQVFELYSHGQLFAKRLLESVNTSGDEIKIYINKIQEVEKVALKTRHFSPAVTVLIDFFNTSLKNAPGTSLKEIAESYLITFNDASSLSAMLFDLIQQMVSPYIKVRHDGPTV